MRCKCGLVIYCHPSEAEREYRCVLRVCTEVHGGKMDSINFVFRHLFSFSKKDTIVCDNINHIMKSERNYEVSLQILIYKIKVWQREVSTS